MSTDERQRLWTRNFLLVCLAAGAFQIGLNVLIPMLPLYVKAIGGQDTAVGLVVGVTTGAAVLCRLLGGQAIDSWGSRRLFVAGATIFTVAMLLHNVATDVPRLLILRPLVGIGFGLATTAINVLVVHLAPAKRRGEAIGYFGMFTSLSVAVGPGAGLWLGGITNFILTGFPLVFTASAALAAISLFITPLIRETRAASSPTATRTKPHLGQLFVAAAIPASVVMLLGGAAFNSLTTFLPLYAPAQNVALFFVAYAAATVCSRAFAGKASDRFGRRAVAGPGMALCAMSLATIATSNGLIAILVAGVTFGLGWGAVFPALMALAVDGVTAQERGAAMGMFTAAFDVGMLSAALTNGVIAQAVGYQPVFLVAAGCSALATIYMLAYSSISRQRRARGQDAAVQLD